MKLVIVIAAWVVTVLIGVLGVFAGQTIWFYQEPAVGELGTPASYYVAAYSGIAALALSFIVSLGLSLVYERDSDRTAAAQGPR